MTRLDPVLPGRRLLFQPQIPRLCQSLEARPKHLDEIGGGAGPESKESEWLDPDCALYDSEIAVLPQPDEMLQQPRNVVAKLRRDGTLHTVLWRHWRLSLGVTHTQILPAKRLHIGPARRRSGVKATPAPAAAVWGAPDRATGCPTSRRPDRRSATRHRPDDSAGRQAPIADRSTEPPEPGPRWCSPPCRPEIRQALSPFPEWRRGPQRRAPSPGRRECAGRKDRFPRPRRR